MSQIRLLFVVVGVFCAAIFLSSCTTSQAPASESEVPRITVEELKERLDGGEAIVIGDLRGQGSYDVRHIPGAISTPENQIEALLDGLPRDQEIILYCA